MGLDVIFKKGKKPLTWNNPIMGDFPFQAKNIPYYISDENGLGIEQKGDPWVTEITGMLAYGEVSFRGRGYSSFANQVELPWDFYNSFTPEELSEQEKALAAYLAQFEGQDGDTELPAGEKLGRIRLFHTLLKWAVKHKLGTIASY